MEVHLQFGYGMMEHCRHLLSRWEGGTVVLSPRDLNDGQLRALASDITRIDGGKVLLDPQFYLPHADHARLRSHDFWPEDFASGSFIHGAQMSELISKLIGLNGELGSEMVVLPGMLATAVDDLWLTTHQAFLDTARDLAGGTPLMSTIALDADTTRDREQVATLLEAAASWRSSAYYLVCEHPKGDYLVQDPIWLANVLDLTAGLRLLGANVVIGYCNHQMLVANVAGANAICSGTWMNVRSFPPDKFRTSYDEEIRRRATWYYCPQALSEYKIPFLDVAYQQGVLDSMEPLAELDGGYVDKLFGGIQPSTVKPSEQATFRHYLHALRSQARSLGGASSYDQAKVAQEEMLATADDLISRLTANGVRGANRDFGECVEVNQAALSVFDTVRGPMLRRKWSSLS